MPPLSFRITKSPSSVNQRLGENETTRGVRGRHGAAGRPGRPSARSTQCAEFVNAAGECRRDTRVARAASEAVRPAPTGRV